MGRLNERQFDKQEYDEETGRPKMFHGTGHDFSYGMVLPSSALGMHRTKWRTFYEGNEAWRKDRVFASQNERSAWNWAQGPGRPRVHEVHVQDPRHGPEGGGEWHGEHAMVKDTRWTPPPMQKPGAWVQGTLPPNDWGKGANWTHGADWPTDEPEPGRNLHPQQFAGQGRLFE